MHKSALMVSTSIGLMFGTAASASVAIHNGALKRPINAQHFRNAPARPQKVSTPGKPKPLVEQYVVDTWSTDEASLPAGFTTLKSVPLKCKKACTIITDTVAQVMSYYSYNSISLCPAVDGYFTNGSCMLSGAGVARSHAPDAGFLPVPQLTNISVGAGNHTGEFYVYTFAPAYIGGYQIDWHVYN